MQLGVQIGILDSEWGDGRTDNSRAAMEDAIRVVSGLGVRGIETFARHVDAFADDPEILVDLLREQRVSLSGAYLQINEVLQDGGSATISASRRTIQTLAAVGGAYLILNGGPRYQTRPGYTASDFSQLARASNEIGSIARDLGVGVAMHPHVASMVETCDHVDALLEAGLDTDLVGLCVHASHQLIAGADPYIMYEKHAGIVSYLHLGNSGIKDGSEVGLLMSGDGLDQSRLMSPLLAAGFDGWAVVECGQAGQSHADYIADTRAFLRDKFALSV